MVLLVADLSGAHSTISTQVNIASSGQWDGHTLILVINSPLLMQFKGKIQVTLHK